MTKAKFPMAASKKRAKADRNQQILLAALGRFAEKGYEATPVPEIAKDVGLAVGGLYRYYASKESIANAVYQQAMDICTEMLLEGFPQKRSSHEKFQHLWGRLHRFATEHTNEFIFLELHNHSTYLNKKSEAADQRLLGAMDAYVRDAQKKGDIRKMETALVVSIWLNIYVGYFKAVQDGEIMNAKSALKHAEEAAWRAVARQES